MAIVTRVHGSAGDAAAGVLSGGTNGSQAGASLKFYLVDAGANIVSLDGVGGAFEALVKTMPPVLAYSATGTAGVVSFICDGVNAPPAADVQAQIRLLGNALIDSYDFTGATCADGVAFLVS